VNSTIHTAMNGLSHRH